MWNGLGCGGWGGGVGGLGMILMAVLLLALIGLAIFGATRLSQPGTYSRGVSDALDIAKERYAKGEITEKEFAQIKKSLF